MPTPEQMFPIESVRPVKGYKERFVMGMDEKSMAHLTEEKRAFWKNLSQSVCGERLAAIVANKFAPFLQARFKDAPNTQLYHETLLIQDTTNYSIGPHTDT